MVDTIRRGAPSLRRRLAAIGLTIAAIALVACAALVVWITTMHRSTVTIVAAMERVRIVEETEITLTVSDSGIGIAEQDRGRLFEPFQRVGETKRVIAGVGLGLFIVRRIVEAHGGRIAVDSAPGRGSTFTVQIPQEAASAA